MPGFYVLTFHYSVLILSHSPGRRVMFKTLTCEVPWCNGEHSGLWIQWSEFKSRWNLISGQVTGTMQWLLAHVVSTWKCGDDSTCHLSHYHHQEALIDSLIYYIQYVGVGILTCGAAVWCDRRCIKRTGYSVGGGAPFIPMKVAQWRMKPKNEMWLWNI